MAFDFPNSPAVDELATFDNIGYRWTGEAWTRRHGGIASGPPSLTPKLTSLAPNTIMAGSANASVTLTGTKFTAASVVNWNGADVATTFVSTTQLTVNVPHSTAVEGTVPVFVKDGAETSNSLNFTYTPFVAVPVPPVLTQLLPAQGTIGSADITVRVLGTNFLAATELLWNGNVVPHTFVSATELTTVVSVANASVSTAQVSSRNDTLVSNALVFAYVVATPALVSINPSSMVIGGTDATVTLTGTGFMNISEVLWDNVPVPTTFVSSTQLTISIQPSAAVEGQYLIGVRNDTVKSNELTFTYTATAVVPIQPALTLLNPSTRATNSGDFVLDVRGSNFSVITELLWDGVPITCDYISPTQMNTIIKTATALAGIVQVTTRNDTLVSNALPFNYTQGVITPTLTTIVPNAVSVGEAADTLVTLTGTNFSATSVIQWAGAPVTTNFVSATELTTTIKPNTAAVGTVQVFVQDGTQASNTLNFTYMPVASTTVVLTLLTPDRGFANTADVIVTLTGTGFTAASRVVIDSVPVPTTFVSSTELTVTLDTANKPLKAVPVAVIEGTGMSNSLNFTYYTSTLVSIDPPIVEDTFDHAETSFIITGDIFDPASSRVFIDDQVYPSVAGGGGTTLTVLVRPSVLGFGTHTVKVLTGIHPSNELTFETVEFTSTLEVLEPASYNYSDPTVTWIFFKCHGQDFTDSPSQIYFDGEHQTTTIWENNTPNTTSLECKLTVSGRAAGTYPVTVRTQGRDSNPLTFTLTVA